MSESPSDAPDNDWPKEKPSSGKRGPILYTILALMLAAAAYDLLVARPAVNKAFDEIAAASVKANADGGDFLSNIEVREILGKQPSQTFLDGEKSVEVYNFMGGLIVKPHKLYAVYQKTTSDEWMFYRHSAFAYEPSNSAVRVIEVDENPNMEGTLDSMQEESYGADSGGGGGGGGRPGGRPGGEGGPGGGGSDTDSSSRAPAADSSSRPPAEEAPAEEAPAEEAPAEEAPAEEAPAEEAP